MIKNIKVEPAHAGSRETIYSMDTYHDDFLN